MYQRDGLRFASLTIALFLIASVSIGQDLVRVDEKTIDDFWIPAPERMSPEVPAWMGETFAALKTYPEVLFEYEVTIDANGDPRDFKFLSITPSELNPLPYQASVMFYRYKPAPGRSATPVRFIGVTRWWDPRKSNARSADVDASGS